MSSRSEFFSKFPIVSYNNVYAIDLMRRIRAREEFKKEGINYYDYTVKEGERPDTVSNAFYENPYYTWVMYLLNNYTDPLFEWFKDQQTFENYLIGKYGSLDAALSKTAYYRVDTTLPKITKATYNSLSALQKKYWTRAFATPQQEETYWKQEETKRDYSQFVYYEITKIPLQSETNIVVKIEYTKASGNSSIAVGDIIQKIVGGSLQARGEVASMVDGALYIKHVTDTNYYSSNGATTSISGTMDVRNKDVTINVLSSTVVSSWIPIDESGYWKPITYYDLEQEINQSRSLINLTTGEYVRQIDDELRQLMKD